MWLWAVALPDVVRVTLALGTYSCLAAFPCVSRAGFSGNVPKGQRVTCQCHSPRRRRLACAGPAARAHVGSLGHIAAASRSFEAGSPRRRNL